MPKIPDHHLWSLPGKRYRCSIGGGASPWRGRWSSFEQMTGAEPAPRCLAAQVQVNAKRTSQLIALDLLPSIFTSGLPPILSYERQHFHYPSNREQAMAQGERIAADGRTVLGLDEAEPIADWLDPYDLKPIVVAPSIPASPPT